MTEDIHQTPSKKFEQQFMTHRNGLNKFYKNQKFKVITQEGSLIDNKSRDLIERSGTAAHYQGRK